MLSTPLKMSLKSPNKTFTIKAINHIEGATLSDKREIYDANVASR